MNMKINKINPANITRTTAKKEAEKICRLLNSEFPTISSTQICEFDRTKATPRFQLFSKNIEKRIFDFVRDPSWKDFMKFGPDRFYITFVDLIKQFKVANCSDRSKLYNLLAQINSLDTKKAEMFLMTPSGAMGDRIDHAIQILPINGQDVKFDKLSKMKDLLIIDPWLGFADFAPKYEQKIKSDYHRFFQIPDGDSIVLNPYVNPEPEISENLINYFKKHFPNMNITDYNK